MNAKLLVKISNSIGLISIILLIYWVFTFVLIQVFGLKIFRQHLTESFLMSILGILALMGGALMLNIMFNLTRIAERAQPTVESKTPKKTLGACLALFPIIAALLFGGDYLSTQKKQKMLVNSADSMIQNEQNRFQQLTNYQFNESYILQTAVNLKFLAILDRSFADVQVIIADKIENNPVYLGFTSHPYYTNENNMLEQAAEDAAIEAARAVNEISESAVPVKTKLSLDKKRYVKQLSLAEKEYLKTVFEQGNKEILFQAEDGDYQLYLPYRLQNKTIVLYFSDRQRYGKYGS